MTFEEQVPRGAEQGNAKRTRKRSTLRVLIFARKFSETVSDELCKVSQKQQHKTFCMWLETIKKDFSYFQWLNLHLISLYRTLSQSNLCFSVIHEEDRSNENKFSETVLIFFFEPIVKYVDF